MPSTPEELGFTRSELGGLRRDLISVCYYQTAMKLAIYQRGQRLTVSNSGGGGGVVAAMERRRSSVSSRSRGAAKDSVLRAEGMQSEMPDEKVLNAIKLEKELDEIIRIYDVANEELYETAPAPASPPLLPDPSGIDDDGNEDENATGAHRRLVDAVGAFKGNKTPVGKLLQELQESRDTVTALTKQLAQERQDAEQVMEVNDDRIGTLRHQLKNVRKVNDMELKLVERWEENRFSQATIVGENEERALHEQIDDLRRRLAGEQLINREVTKYNERQFADLRSRIANWQKKYAVEMTGKQADIYEEEHRIGELQKVRERHEEVSAQRRTFITEYLAERAEQEKLLKAEMHRIDSAVRIQAWWRGVMVRRGLGAYKKRVRKGRKGKAKK